MFLEHGNRNDGSLERGSGRHQEALGDPRWLEEEVLEDSVGAEVLHIIVKRCGPLQVAMCLFCLNKLLQKATGSLKVGVGNVNLLYIALLKVKVTI